jgi:DNA-directed RNA polymerase specialized sigma24 family protein
MSGIHPRLSADEVVRLLRLYQEGSASQEQENQLGQWVWGTFYKMFRRESPPDEAEDKTIEACERFWRAIGRREFQW